MSIRCLKTWGDSDLVISTKGGTLFRLHGGVLSELRESLESRIDVSRLTTKIDHAQILMQRHAFAGINAICSLPHEATVLTAGDDTTLRCWDLDKGCLSSVRVFNEVPTSLSCHPSGTSLAIGFKNGKVCLWLCVYEISFSEIIQDCCIRVSFSHEGNCESSHNG